MSMSASRQARLTVPLLAGLLTLAVPSLAAAQEASAAAIAAWNRFLEICPAALAAPDPVGFSATAVEGASEINQTIDGNIRIAHVQFSDGDIGADLIILTTILNSFDEGRSVQCMFQAVHPVEPLTGLVDLAAAQAAEVLGSDSLVSAGGATTQVSLDGDIRGPEGDEEMLRISTAGFPPMAQFTVQTGPQIAMLILHAWQPADE